MSNINSISNARLSFYKSIFQCGSDQEALRYYYWNQAVSAELYVLLHNLEVCLRNRIHEELSLALSNQTSSNYAWYDQFDFSLPGFDRFGQPNLTITGKSIDKVKGELTTKGKPLTPQNIICNLEFGKWPHILKTRNLKNGTAIDWATFFPAIFPQYNHSSKRLRKRLFERLEEVRLLRNRVAHLEPVWKFDSKTINGSHVPAPTDLGTVLNRLNKEISWTINVLEWLCTDTHKHYIQTNSFRKLRMLVSDPGTLYFSI